MCQKRNPQHLLQHASVSPLLFHTHSVLSFCWLITPFSDKCLFSALHGYWTVMSWRLRIRVYMTTMCPTAGWVWLSQGVSSGVVYLVMFLHSQDSKCPASALLAAGCLLVLGILLAVAVIEMLKNEDRIHEALNPPQTQTCCNQTGPIEHSRWAHFLFFYALTSCHLQHFEFKTSFCLALDFAEYMDIEPIFSLHSISFSLKITPTSEFPVEFLQETFLSF